jgi:DNA-binding cell septation regulator SpoVG
VSSSSRPDPTISCVQIRPTCGGKNGLVAWVSCVLDGRMALNNIALRRDAGGDLYLTYPRRRSSSGTCYPYFCPVSESARLEIESEILASVESAVPALRGEERCR